MENKNNSVRVKMVSGPIFILVLVIVVVMLWQIPNHRQNSGFEQAVAQSEAKLPDTEPSMPAMKDDHVVVIEHGGSVTFVPYSKDQPEPVTERQILEMQPKSHLVPVNKQNQ